MFLFFLCDSLLCGHKSFGVRLHQLADETPDAKTNAATARSDRAVDRATSRVCSACLCIASGGALVMGGGDHCPHSAVGLAMKALTEPAVYQELAKDPKVNVLVLRAAMSTAKCRSHGEQFPKVVKERRQCQMIQDLETPWSVCDLEDVIRDRPDRQRFPELEACRLRHAQGIYGGGDDLHFRKDIAVAAGDELLKALRRTALQKYPEMEGDDSILLVLAAGWNTEDGEYNCLDSDGHCWRKTELVALAELCALNGRPFSSFHAKFEQLLNRCQEEHIAFIFQDLASITAASVAPHFPKPLSKPSQQLLSETVKRKRLREKTVAEELAEITGVPLDTAESIISVAGGLSEALEHPMFKQDMTREIKHARNEAPFQELVPSHKSIDLDAPEDPGKGANSALSELLSMGFPQLAAETALHCANGNLSQALEDLLST
ncbi:unnamed protein product [Durusdinium trenchii]|uniref:UBA domain-containing protein n=1 Tax=Durusdinium trenchii TaxID=1381693 RepID=A0ABP0RPZ0_9DINO